MNKGLLRVLLVEDDEDDFLLTRDLLGDITTFECETHWATTCAAAKQAIAEKTFDVCLIDYRLGARTGLELVREAVAEGFRAPMILLTGQDDHAVDLEAMKAGAADYLIKGKMEVVTLERAIRYAIERRRDEERLREQRDFTSAITNSAGEGIYAIDNQARLKFMNPAAEKMLGWTETELLGKNIHEAIHFQRADGTPFPAEECPLLGVLRSGNSVHIEDDIFTRKDKTTFPVSYKSSPIVSSGQITGAVLSFHDTTEQRRSARKLFTLASIVESSADAITSQTLEGEIISWNVGAEKLYGYSANEIIGQPISILYPPARLGEESQILASILRGEQVQNYETTRVGKDETNIPVSLTASPVRDSAGNIIGISKIVRDITERKRIEKELERTTEAALESARMKSEFLANMSHEIRTPMNGVIGMTGLLLDSDLSARQQQYAKAIESSADALLTIIADILDFSKIEAGRLRFEKIDFDLREAVEHPIEMIAERAQTKGIEIASLILADVPAALRGDPGRLRQILTNLIGNAIKFTESGEVTVNVQKESDTDANVLLRFEVKDTGIGISPEAQKRLFQAFVQADGSTTRKYGGTGLGLAISKQLVEMMGGEIGIESEPGRGATFWFTARFEKQPDQLLTTRPSSEISLEGVRLLIVDDNETSRKILLYQTNSWKMIGTQVDSGTRALAELRSAAARNEPFEVAIVDLMMPNMDGFELAQAIKADPNISETQIILLPLFGNCGDGQAASEAGIAACLQKPVRQSQLHNCLMTLLAEGTVSRSDKHPEQLITKQSLHISPSQNKINFANPEARILVAEDNALNRELVIAQLERLGYSPDVVSNGREAVEKLEKSEYNVVLMDCQMPEMDGFEATAEIRRREGDARHTTIIAVTANALDGDRQKCLDAGMDDYLSKPLKIEPLRQKLEQWIGSFSRKSDTLPELLQNVSENNLQKIVDLSVLEAYKDYQQPGQPDLVDKFIGLFVNDTTLRLSTLRQAVVDADTGTIKSETHNLKGAAGNIGALRMVGICKELEQKASEFTNADVLISQLESEFKQAVEVLGSVRQL